MGNSNDMQKLIDKFHTDYKNSHLRISHISILAIHILICIFFWKAYSNDLIEKETLKTWTMFYFFITTFLLMVAYYRQLRNYKVYILWLLVGIGQFIVYMVTKDNPDFMMFRGSSLTPLRALLIMLVTLQLFRQFYMLLTPWELIITYRRFTWHDTDDNRKMIWLDVVFSIIIYAVTILSCVL